MKLCHLRYPTYMIDNHDNRRTMHALSNGMSLIYFTRTDALSFKMNSVTVCQFSTNSLLHLIYLTHHQLQFCKFFLIYALFDSLSTIVYNSFSLFICHSSILSNSHVT